MNLSSSFKTKLNVSKAHIIANEIKEEDESAEEQINIIQPVRERCTSSIKNTERKRSINSKIKKQQQVNETDLDESSCSEPLNRPRVDRFLSIVEIPPEIIWLTQQAFAKNNAKNESIDEEEEPKLEENKTKPTTLITNKNKKPKIKKKQKRKESFNIFKFDYGSSLTQQAKANIIKEIIKNYDLDLFMNELRSRDVVQINLNKNDANNRSIRNRMMKLMKSDVIRINDGDYMRELSKRIQKNYQDKQDKLMQNLEDRERKRERKLKLKGLITKTSEEEEVEKNKSKTTFNSSSTRLSIRKNSNFLEPIVNPNSNNTNNNNTSTLLGNVSSLNKLPKLIHK